VISDPSTCDRTERADCARVHSRRRWLTMSSAGEGRQNRSPASKVTPAALGLSSELRSPGLPREGGRALAPPCPGNGKAVVLGENGLVRLVVLVSRQRPGVRATAWGPLSAGGGGLQVWVLGAVIWGASGAQDRESPERLRRSQAGRVAGA